MTTNRTIASTAVATAIALLLHAGAAGAQATGKKLYCWDDNGRKVCGDALPPEAAARARSEINARSGMHTAEIGRLQTDEERAAARAAQNEAAVAERAAYARQRRDIAMVESYATEGDLRRAYGERISLLDDSIKASELGEASIRGSLASLLAQAGDLELAGKPVPATTLASLRNQHLELQKQQRLLAQQRADRASLDVELADAVNRYRALKAPAGG